MLLGAAMIVYTVRGGVSAVIWTDVVQMFVYVAGAFVVLVALLAPHPRRLPRSWPRRGRGAQVRGRSTSRPTRTWSTRFWAGLIGGIALTLATHGTDQFLVQRLLSARSARQASAGLVLSGFIVFAQFTLFLFIGVCSSPSTSTPSPPALSRNDEILPVFVVDLAGRRAGRVHRRGDRRRGAVAVAQRDGGHDGQRFLSTVRRPRRRRSHADARLAQRDHRLGRRADRGRARRAVDGPVGARRRPRGAVARERARCSARSSWVSYKGSDGRPR